MYGAWGRILEVDLTRGKTWVREYEEGLVKEYIGGSGMGAKILFAETGREIDPLGPENLLIFMAGPLTGTIVPTSGRHELITKSPLTGIYAESDAGGYFGTALKKCGYDGMIVVGRAAKPVYIYLTDESVEIRSAGHVWGLDTYRADGLLKEETDRNAVIAVIGQAGEKLVKLAAIMHDGKDARAAGRCGTGAVMGSKNLKAIACHGSKPIPLFDPKGLAASVRKYNKMLRENTLSLGQLGSAGAIESIEMVGDIPIKNWQLGSWPEGAANLSGTEMEKRILTGKFHCHACPIGCGRKVALKAGKYAGVEGAGYEYETAAMLGVNCLVDDLEAVAYANELCNKYGLDTISVGGVIAFAMECYEQGLLTKADTGGLELTWGSADSLIELIKLLGEKRGIGAILGEGVKAAAEKIGNGSQDYAMHVKGLELPAHDPRAYNSLAVAYATSNRGACHLQGFTNCFELFLAAPELGYKEPLDRFSLEGKGKFTAQMQNLMSLYDSLKVCKYLTFGGISIAALIKWFYLATGIEFTLETFLAAGERLYNLKRLYNVRCGITRADDNLPKRIRWEKRGSGGAAENLPDLEVMLEDYYAYRGWDENGIPTQEKIRQLGLEALVAGTN